MGARWLNPLETGYSFEEEFGDLIELNCYRVENIAKSSEGWVEIVATRTDEVGHKVTYSIHCKKNDGAVDDADVERAAKASDSQPGRIIVVVSPSSGFSRSAADLAQRLGVRLWGAGEIERLRRNVAEKRGLCQREAMDRSDIRDEGAGLRSKAGIVAVLLILSIAILYVKSYGFDAAPMERIIEDLSDMMDRGGLGDLEVSEILDLGDETVRRAFGALQGWLEASLEGFHNP